MSMVRIVGVSVGLAIMAMGLWALFAGVLPPALVFTLEGAVIIAGVLFERVVYKHVEAARPGAGWTRTAERFIDDATGKPVTVYVQPATGERKYVNE
jgi:hypothetical protein